MNPICKREMKAAVRSVRIPAIITACSSILALVALLSMYLNVTQVRITAQIQYGSFLELYIFVTVIEFLMLVFLMPALTSGAISGERERQTLDIMMTTRVSKWDIVSGKLISSLMVMFLVIISTFPIMALVFVYGGIGWLDLGLILLCYVASALLTGGIGIFCSAFFRRSTISTVIAYSMTAVVFIGTYVVNFLVVSLGEISLAPNGMEEAAGNSGGFLYVLLLNPSATFAAILGSQMNPTQIQPKNWFGLHEDSIFTEHWIVISIALQLALAACFIGAAVKVMDRERLKRKHV